MNPASPEQDELAGRCRFCGAQLPPDATVCPECGRDVAPGYSFRLRRPIWVRVLIYAILALFFGALLAWGIDLLLSGLTHHQT